MSKKRRCECCGKKIRLMCQTRWCGGLCETRKCGHRPMLRPVRRFAPEYPTTIERL